MRCTTPYCRIRIFRSKSNFLLPVMALLACGAAMAQSPSPTYKVGRSPTAEELRTWDNLVGAKGKELPIGSGSAVEGAPIFAAKCAVCHGKDGQGGVPTEFGFTYPRLVGGVGTLNTPNAIKTSGSWFPYATTLFDYIQRAMPVWPMPRDLTSDDVYALTAFILYKNGIIKETDAMNKATLAEVQMPNRHGFYPDPPQSAPDKDRGWLPYWNQAPGWKPAAK
jgi:mono/diheme cytochrome c family protein